MPQNRTRYWYWVGIFRYEKISAITKMLSTESDHSSR